MTGMSFQKRLSSFPHRSNEDQLLICKHCNNTLICCQEGTSSSSYEWKNCWLAFMWNMFKDLLNQQFAMNLWRYVPFTMCFGWLSRSYQGISENHALASLYEPRSYFEDVCKMLMKLTGWYREL